MPVPYQLPDLIADRLSSIEWPVLVVADLAGIAEEAQVAPAVQIIPYGIQLADAGMVVSVRENVLIMAVARFVNQRGGTGARQLAGPILSAVSELLVNWQPASDYTPLVFATPPQPQFTAGFGYYPLQFSSIYTLE